MAEQGATATQRTGIGPHRILVASDLTADSDRAFDRATMLAEANRADICFLHAVDVNLLPERYIRSLTREAQAQLEREVLDSPIDKQLNISVTIKTGDADRIVVEEARSYGADLIVMGLSRAATLQGITRGTTIDKVVRATSCPVLIVKTRPRRKYANVVVAADLREPSRQALDLALRTFPQARITVVHVDESAAAGSTIGGERRNQIEDMLKARCVAAGRAGPGTAEGPVLVLRGGKALDVLQEEVSRLDPDLVVLGTHGRTGVAKLFLGSVAETLIEVLPRDILISRA